VQKHKLKKLGNVWASEDDFTLQVGVIHNYIEQTLFVKLDNQESFLIWVNAIRKAKRPQWALNHCCAVCQKMFSLILKRHHCRKCGEVMVLFRVYVIIAAT